MKRSSWFWTGFVLACLLLRETLAIPLPVIMLAAFCASWAIFEANNRDFDRKLAQMAKEARERGNA